MLMERIKNLTLEDAYKMLDFNNCVFLEQNKICVQSEKFPEDGNIISIFIDE